MLTKGALRWAWVMFFSIGLAGRGLAGTVNLTGLSVTGSISGTNIGPAQQYSPATVLVSGATEFVSTVPEEGGCSHTLHLDLRADSVDITLTIYPTVRDVRFYDFDIHLLFETGDVIDLHHDYQWFGQPQVNDSGQVFRTGFSISEDQGEWSFIPRDAQYFGSLEWVQGFDLVASHSIIPEPATVLLVGLGALWLLRRRKA